MLSFTEENYLKAIFKLSEKTDGPISTNAIAHEMNTAAASVTDMVKRLAKNDFILYERYKGVFLSKQGDIIARKLIRKHRLWEVFLFDKLNFTWDEVHDIAEQLEHIQSEELVDRMDKYLGSPKFDPHGDPIPNKNGQFAIREQDPLSELVLKDKGIIVGVREHSKAFLQYLEQCNLVLGTHVAVLEIFDYDGSIKIKINHKIEQIITQKVANNLFIIKEE